MDTFVKQRRAAVCLHRQPLGIQEPRILDGGTGITRSKISLHRNPIIEVPVVVRPLWLRAI